jgi:hypothetical protein
VSKVDVIKFELVGETDVAVVIPMVEICSADVSVEEMVTVELEIIFVLVLSVSMFTLILV